MENQKEKLSALALSVMSEPASKGFWDLFSRALSAEALAEEVFARREPTAIDYVAKIYSSSAITAASAILHEASCRNIEIDTFLDREYPPLLREISRPPLVLYRIGKPVGSRNLAVVGTRKPDREGAEMADRLSRELARAGCTIVSGMAAGIDRAAHLGALKEEGRTVGVTANGLDIMYPSANRDLYQAVLNNRASCLVSEYPPKIYGGKFSFVKRNRIISGISQGTLVVQAPKRSGALITAEYALNQNRDIFACTGRSFDENYHGCHRLIQEGALLVTGADDILQSLGWQKGGEEDDRPSASREAEGHEELYLDFKEVTHTGLRGRVQHELREGQSNVDALTRKLKASSSELQEILLCMELDGEILRRGNSIEYIKRGRAAI